MQCLKKSGYKQTRSHDMYIIKWRFRPLRYYSPYVTLRTITKPIELLTSVPISDEHYRKRRVH